MNQKKATPKPESKPQGKVAEFLQSEQLGTQEVVAAIGGIRGLVETTVPALAFLTVYGITQQLWWAVGLAVATSVAAIIIRAAQRVSVQPAVNGLVAVAISAALALWTGRAEDNYLIGLWGSAIYAVALSISLLVGWPAVGIVVGLLTSDWSWRTQRRTKVAYMVLTLVWLGVFLARFLVQLPLYLDGNVAGLGITRIIMGTPMFALALVVTWVVVKGLRSPAVKENG